MGDDGLRIATPDELARLETINDLTIIAGFARVVERRAQRGLRQADADLIRQMRAVIAAAARIEERQ